MDSMRPSRCGKSKAHQRSGPAMSNWPACAHSRLLDLAVVTPHFQNGSVSGRSGQRHVIISSWNWFSSNWPDWLEYSANHFIYALARSNLLRPKHPISKCSHSKSAQFCTNVKLSTSIVHALLSEQIASAPFNTPIANGFVKRFVYTIFIYEHTSKTCPLQMWRTDCVVCAWCVCYSRQVLRYVIKYGIGYILYCTVYSIYGIICRYERVQHVLVCVSVHSISKCQDFQNKFSVGWCCGNACVLYSVGQVAERWAWVTRKLC